MHLGTLLDLLLDRDYKFLQLPNPILLKLDLRKEGRVIKMLTELSRSSKLRMLALT